MSSSSVLNLPSVSTNQGSSIGAALSEVAVAFKHLASALLRSALVPAPTRALSAFEEAEALRSYAIEIQRQDPQFAQDLFAAADRHEVDAAAANAR